jgi:glycosyltransferase involved in cell wall biosynthesis
MAQDVPAGNIGDGVRQDIYGGLSKAVRIMRKEPADIAIVTGTGWKAMGSVALLPRNCRKVFFEVMSGARLRWLDPRMLVHLGFDAVVGQAKPVEARFKFQFGWRGPSAAIPALPEPLELNCQIPPRTTRALCGGAPLRFAFFGRLAPHKRADLLIDRWYDYAPAGSTLDIWGSGSEASCLRSMIDSRGLQKSIALRGRYPDGAAYVKLLQSYDLSLLPTVGNEGAPLVLLESMACGLPFVANGVGGIPDYTNPDCAITGGDIEEFVPAVQSMVGKLQNGGIDPGRLQRHYQTQFSFVRLIDRWERFLCKLVGSISDSST